MKYTQVSVTKNTQADEEMTSVNPFDTSANYNFQNYANTMSSSGSTFGMERKTLSLFAPYDLNID